jgi:glycosyltransferase involved in cell wall biosynthesis
MISGSIPVRAAKSLSSRRVRIVQLNLASDPAAAAPEQLLERYHTLTGWSRAVTGAGADVRVIQRFTMDATETVDGVAYRFVRDGAPGMALPWTEYRRVVAAVASCAPDAVHVNGLMFPGTTRAVRRAVAPRSCVVLQDHSGALPRRVPWPLAAFQARRWAAAFRTVDACSFTARGLAARWREAGLPQAMPIVEIPEASTDLRPIDRHAARARTGVIGDPAILWVGRLDANKDPATVLTAFDLALPSLRDARMWMIVPAGAPQQNARAQIAATPSLRARVTMIGAVDRSALAPFYSAADVFVSGSHHEGSGYALIEALACGVTPCVTNIPAFRALVGGTGPLWTPGDPSACRSALIEAAARATPGHRSVVRRYFDDRLAWDVIGRETVAAYAGILAARRRTTT